MKSSWTVALLVCACLSSTAWPASAAPILAPGAYPQLDANMTRHARQFYGLNALPFGLSLNGHVSDDAARALIDDFLAQDATDDVRAVTGKHPFEIFSEYGEYGDLGFFGGVALAGTAFHYAALKREGAPEKELSLARARLVRAAESWHVFYVVSGGGGLVARGIRRMEPEDPNDPPIPVTYPDMVPLFDDAGQALPQPKDNGTYRWDNSGGALPEGVWIWKDSCSKDQLVGQVFAMTAMVDAMDGDPDIDQTLVERMREDARGVGEMLMTKREIGELEGAVGKGLYDLIIMDADGRPTYHHDLNPLSLEKLYFAQSAEAFNRFNLLMAIGVIKGLHHVTGDPRLEKFLYEEMYGRRQYLEKVNQEEGSVDYIYMGSKTNFDNPDMTALALWLGLYLEGDPAVAFELRRYLEDGWWNRAGEPHTARLSKQPLWHAIYLSLTDRGVDPALVDELVDLLLGFDLGPYWNDQRINCDADEIAAKQCVAVDGTTILTLDRELDDGNWMATESLHPRIRPPSDFDARSNPFTVNGGGGLRLNPGGDLYAAYWIARATQSRASGEVSVSPFARSHMPVGGLPATQDDTEADGCGCRASGSQSNAGAWWIAASVAAAFAGARLRRRDARLGKRAHYHQGIR